MSPVGPGKPAVAFGEVGGDRNNRAIELIGKEIKSSGERSGQRNNVVSESNGFLINPEVFKEEGRIAIIEQWRVEQSIAGRKIENKKSTAILQQQASQSSIARLSTVRLLYSDGPEARRNGGGGRLLLWVPPICATHYFAVYSRDLRKTPPRKNTTEND